MVRDEMEIIRNLIIRETRYLRHYTGIVQNVDDPLSSGRVQVMIPALGWSSVSSARWCWPRDRDSMVPAHVDDTVEVYFMDGRPDRPVYLGQAHEVAGNKVDSYLSPDEPVLYQNPETGDKIVYSEAGKSLEVVVEKLLRLLTEKLEVGAATEAMVLGDQLMSYVSGLKSWMDAHVHTISSGSSAGLTTGPTVASPTVPEFRSVKMFGE